MTSKENAIRMSFSEELSPAKIKVIGVGGGEHRLAGAQTLSGADEVAARRKTYERSRRGRQS